MRTSLLSLLSFVVLAGIPGLGGNAAAQDRQNATPLSQNAAWRDGIAGLERYRQGGTPPAPLRISVFSAPPGASPDAAPLRRSSPVSITRDPGLDWQNLIRSVSARYGLDEALLTAVLRVESGFNPNAVSRQGARGAMQLMPATGRELGLTDFFDPAANTDAGARYLAGLLREFHSIELSLAAYNAGPDTVRRHGGIPPYRETRAYVSRVISEYHRLKNSRPVK
ncbi:MAG: lytic transglycosylase domain-containing protein [Deltaproteobacteria bacterium]|jgi:soluble lytic murein transglycosylase-like protein|nr:lytic transglycosylase domain-containing protein [Deltaproteobacteria bacterium]